MTTKSLFLKNIWYYAMPGHQLKSGKIVIKTLLNESIVFGRSQLGTIFALRNFGSDQAMSLSTENAEKFKEHKRKDKFPSYKFNENEQCTLISLLTGGRNDDKSYSLTKSYLVCEVQGNIWIYIGSDENINPQEDVPRVPAFDNQAYQAACVMQFPSNIDCAVVGLIDPAHIAFVHKAWWWRSPATLQEVVKTFDPSFHGFTMRRHLLEQQTFFYRLIGRNLEVEISFRLPGIRIEHLSTSQNTVCSLTATTPISDTETEVTTLLYTTLPWFTLLKPLMLYFMHSFLAQDREILRKQQAGLQHAPPMTLVGDADAQARWYYRLKKEFARAAAEGRPFTNPLKAQTLHWRS